MSPILALFLTVGFIGFLFRRDFREKANVTGALWIPFFWMVISGSRSVSEWLGILGVSVGAGSLEEGSPIDRLVYIGLIVGGLYVLNKRRVNLAEIIRNNKWLAFFLLYCFLAILWSDFPIVALKRWTKVIGHPLMVLIIFTEPDPEEALKRLMKRCAYILVPVSILFIKYYPEYGRGFSQWTGEAYNTGITNNKNLLGCDCLILGFFFVWHFLTTRQMPKSKARRNELLLTVGFIYMIWWLLSMANSQTSFTALLAGIFVLLFAGWRWVDKRWLGMYIVVGVLIIVSAQYFFGIYETVLGLLGRDATLTERTVLWEDVLKVDINPVFGAGFESFWMGERQEAIWEKHTWRPNQAHNGYLETYLNLGVIGLFLLIGLIFVTYAKARRELVSNFEFGRFRLGYLAAAVAYNWTEAGFKTTHFIFYMFYIIAIDCPKPRTRPTLVPTTRAKREGLIYAQERI